MALAGHIGLRGDSARFSDQTGEDKHLFYLRITYKNMKNRSKPKAPSPQVKLSAGTSQVPRTKSLCLPHLPISPDASPVIHQANKRYSFSLAAHSALTIVSSVSTPKPSPTPLQFLPPTHCYLPKKSEKLRLRFTHIAHTLTRIPSHDFITALLNREPFADDVLAQNIKKHTSRHEDVYIVREEEEEGLFVR